MTNPKSTGGGVADPAQLWTWIFPRADPDSVPMLPIIFGNGDEWCVEFVQRTREMQVGFLTFFAICVLTMSKTIWESIQIGSTDSSHGCYAIIAALQRLAGWCRHEYALWWEKALPGLQRPV
ncbi:hypothetical protein RAB80_017075 [Fusarium oxysporum f. sp. vasinfectum]|nr:hypothetical protein RAB80_017075 [Fusarium oxysporum f. sp. vasinfectum]